MNKKTVKLNFENYANDKAKKVFFYKIALIGPSRVGKTSIVAALLEEAKEALAQTGVSIAPFINEDRTSPTKERIRNTILDIEAGLDFSNFQPTGMGTADPFIFDLVMSLARKKENNASQLRFAILDYPGGWLTEPPPRGQDTWKKCEKWVEDSSVIIIPIDANLIMEADNEHRAKASRELLQVLEVETLVRKWAIARREKADSGLVLFVPVKCETYFNDNGGIYDYSDKLYKRIEVFYRHAIKAVELELSEKKSASIKKSKSSSYKIEYHPIDTIGCIELEDAVWKNTDGKLSLKCEYLVRNISNSSPVRKPLGTIGLLNSICKQIVENRQDSNLFTRFWDWLNDNDLLLNNAISKLSKQLPSSRFKQIANGNIAKKG
ncbi:hypothetical protein [Calothrix sp. CCY 0018]|uniref:hypothetical protein n=1 Tax=Calothrix sp. CCY 0018 TaxID=3103864 RepID=UPI0039C5E1F3